MIIQKKAVTVLATARNAVDHVTTIAETLLYLNVAAVDTAVIVGRIRQKDER